MDLGLALSQANIEFKVLRLKAYTTLPGPKFSWPLPKLFVCQPWSPAIYKNKNKKTKTNKQKTLKKSQRPNFSLSQSCSLETQSCEEVAVS
jgi:hypothetical protein